MHFLLLKSPVTLLCCFVARLQLVFGSVKLEPFVFVERGVDPHVGAVPRRFGVLGVARCRWSSIRRRPRHRSVLRRRVVQLCGSQRRLCRHLRCRSTDPCVNTWLPFPRRDCLVLMVIVCFHKRYPIIHSTLFSSINNFMY